LHRSLVLAVFCLLAVAAGAIWFLLRDDALAPIAPGGGGSGPSASAAAENAPEAPRADERAPGRADRDAVTVVPADWLADPEIQAGLSGFKGRVVDHGKLPVADCGVRIYRGAMNVVLPESVDVFADAPSLTPQYVAGEVQTGADGRFTITGVWPRAFYVMFAGIGTDAPVHQVVTRTPSPGEIVDLGDIELPDAGVITGTVVDEDGEPLPGVLIRAADVPGTLAALFPAERFDPEGAVLIREPQSPVKVVEMPAWVKSAFEHVPIPKTLSGADGTFRLAGVVPGSNMLAATKRDYLSVVKPSIPIKAGQEKDVGRIRLERGEELTGRVVDTAGRPIAGAEVFAGSTLSIAPVDLAQRVGETDAEGRFRGQGFAPGKVTVAARRDRGQPWVLAEPQAILGDVVVTLPATFAAIVTVSLPDGAPAKEPRLRLLQGKAGDGAAEMAVLGFVPPVDLRDRVSQPADGQWRIDNLLAGRYTIVADAPGFATAFAAIEITTADAAVALQLEVAKEFHVRVVGPGEKPIRNVAIYAESTNRRLFDMPLHCGRTDGEGRLVVARIDAKELRVSGDHPRFGVVHGLAKLGEELVLRMEQPGSLLGFLTEGGHPPAPGSHTVAIERRRGDGPRGAIEDVPMLVSPAADGTFAVRALQPGKYRVHALKSLDALRSPGGLFAFMQDTFTMRDTPSAEVSVVTGQQSEVRLDASPKAIEGPTAHVFGSVQIDGQLGTGCLVSAWGNDRRFTAKVDERGQFDLGTVSAGDLWVQVTAAGEGMFFPGSGSTLWNGRVTVAAAEERELALVLQTSSISGVCLLADGTPAAGVFVQARGRLKGAPEGQGETWLGEPTDAQGKFHFKRVSEGTWRLEVRSGGDGAGRGAVEGVVVAAGMPIENLRIELQKGIVVKGTVALAALGQEKPRWVWVAFHRPPAKGDSGDVGEQVDGASIDAESGRFSTGDLGPGRYHVRVHASFGENDYRHYSCDPIEVPAQGLDDLLLRPVVAK
jgi:uncharacterized GH25 family protein